MGLIRSKLILFWFVEDYYFKIHINYQALPRMSKKKALVIELSKNINQKILFLKYKIESLDSEFLGFVFRLLLQ